MSFLKKIQTGLASLFSNPVFINDIKIKQRKSSKVKLKLPDFTGYLVILMIPAAVGAIAESTNSSTFYAAFKSGFIAMCFLQVLVYCYRAAAYSSDAIAGERERRTFESLAVTVMSPLEIAKGKFWTTFFPLAREVTMLLPVFALIGVLAGVNWLTITLMYLLTLADIAFFAAVGLFHSSKAFSAMSARSGSMGTLFLLTIGMYLFGGMATGFIFAAFSIYGGQYMNMVPMVINMIISSVNPLSTVWSVIFMEMMNRNAIPDFPGPFMFIKYMQYIQPVCAFVFYYLIGIRLFRTSVDNIGNIATR
ncbi:MAG: hypothetical protein LWY06_18865 [Firmicutes bacterium]|nr:hypothetical protein [Bacillota bacterium]